MSCMSLEFAAHEASKDLYNLNNLYVGYMSLEFAAHEASRDLYDLYDLYMSYHTGNTFTFPLLLSTNFPAQPTIAYHRLAAF